MAGRRGGGQLSLRSSRAVPPLVTARWLEGFLDGGGTLLAHSDELWGLVNDWLMAQPANGFIELLPGAPSVPLRGRNAASWPSVR